MDNIDAFSNALINILPFSNQGQQAFFFMLVGIFIGFWVGILPGLGGAATLALMLPFIYTMDPTSAFAFLLGSNAVTATTGDITSILFGVPGEGTTASTIVDGHPMAKNGEAGRALGAALMSSLIGAIFGAFVLALAIPVAAPLVLSIGSPEFFMLALLGITFVGSLSGGNITKGLMAGGLGLVISTVGLDPIRGIPRFTFEGVLGQGPSIFLWDGISLIAVTIGLFAIPEIIDLAIKGTSIAREKVEKLGGVMEGVKDAFRHWWLVLKCSALGAYVGILPGVGGGTAQWVAYAYAVQSSPNKERFGKGAVEGVLGPGAANNSTRGGDLITTVAFGIPSSVSTAILFGAFLIQGIVPGPDMLNPAKHLTLTFSFVWIIIVANIITVAVCFLFLKQLAKITNIRGVLLIPFLLLLIYLGGFTVKNSFGDMIMVLIFGALGWLMVQFDWQRPPLLVGWFWGRSRKEISGSPLGPMEPTGCFTRACLSSPFSLSRQSRTPFGKFGTRKKPALRRQRCRSRRPNPTPRCSEARSIDRCSRCSSWRYLSTSCARPISRSCRWRSALHSSPWLLACRVWPWRSWPSARSSSTRCAATPTRPLPRRSTLQSKPPWRGTGSLQSLLGY
jgi:putative tricarboxylic transport membrane protein